MYIQPKSADLLKHGSFVRVHLTQRATNGTLFIVRCMCLSCVNRIYELDCANSGVLTLLLLLPRLLLLMRMLSPVPVCESVAKGMQCLLNIPKMLMVN